MNGTNPKILDEVKEFTEDCPEIREYLIKLILMEFDDRVAVSKRKDVTLDYADNYLEGELACE